MANITLVPSPQVVTEMIQSLKIAVLFLVVATIWGSIFLPALTSAATPPFPAPESSPSPALASVPSTGGEDQTPEPSPHVAEPAPSSLPSPAPSRSFQGPAASPGPSQERAEPPDEGDNSEFPDVTPNSNQTVIWCAVRDEFTDCQYYLSLLDTGNHKWSCVRKQSAQECMEAIKAKKVDLISLDAGLAYIAFSSYTMKAIMAEEYCYHKRSYEAVAVVNKETCDDNSRLSLEDFRGSKSCHPGYRTAAGWNSPVEFLVKTGMQTLSVNSSMRRDETVVQDFFSETCAPSEFDGSGLCTSCSTNGSCDAVPLDKYQGYSGAFRCLTEGVGDIAFLRSDTVSRLSNDGLNAQNWSTRSVNEFMYLCPSGGCRPINENIGDCKFSSVPSNVIMTFNSQSFAKTSAIVKTLLNASWTDFLYSGKNQHDHLLSASTQSLAELHELTRSYLGETAIVAEVMNSLQSIHVSIVPTNTGGNQLSGSFVCISLVVGLVVSSFSKVL